MSCLDLHYVFVSINCRRATSFSHWRCWKRMGWLLFLLKVLDFRQWSIFPANEVILTKPAFPRGGEETWGKCRRKEKLLLPLLGFMGEDSPLPTPALVATWWEVMGTHSSRQMSAPISVSPRALQWLSILNTLPRLSHLGKTVGGEAKTTFIMFKFCNRPFSVNQGSPTCFPLPCSSLQNCFCQSNIVFFNIHAFPSLTWLSWHARHNFLPR